LDSCRHLQEEAFEVACLPVGNDGIVDLEKLREGVDKAGYSISGGDGGWRKRGWGLAKEEMGYDDERIGGSQERRLDGVRAKLDGGRGEWEC
jgi:hypothetical protein